jgi:hypothetical protein
MLYQSDPTGSYVLYYGHLSRYAEGVAEGKKLHRGEVIAYVGVYRQRWCGQFPSSFRHIKNDFPWKMVRRRTSQSLPVVEGRQRSNNRRQMIQTDFYLLLTCDQ